ncbi:MAG: HdeD family acid-resistance protein [Candidatus Geothermincolia bacterium]
MEEEVDIITSSWWSFLIRGIIALAFGIVMIAYPTATAKTFFWIFGVFVLVYGLIDLIRGIVRLVKKEKWLGTFAWGAVGFVIGGIILGNLGQATAGALWVMAILVGIWVIVLGVMELATAFDLPPDTGRGWIGVLGAISIIFGILILVWPFGSVYALMVLVGIYAIIAGLFDIFMSIFLPMRSRKVKKEAA